MNASMYRSLPSLANTSCSFRWSTMYRSPGGPPFALASPAPLILSLMPSSAPFGIDTFRVLTVWVTPSPEHAEHAFRICFPAPLQVGHADIVTKLVYPRFCPLCTWPAPLHVGQVFMSPGFAPCPPHDEHWK